MSVGRSLGLRAVVVGAVVTAVISSIINPDFLGKAWNAMTGGDDPPPGPVLELKTLKPMSILVKVPTAWGLTLSKYNIFEDRGDTPGDAIAAGVNPAQVGASAFSRLYIAASKDGARRLGLPKSADPDAVLLAKLRSQDWTIDQCRLVTESRLQHEALVGQMREWSGCNGFADGTMWIVWARTPDSGALVTIQFDARGNEISRDTALEVMRSVTIDPTKLTG